MAKITVGLGKYDGLGGPGKALAWITEVEDVMRAGGLNQARTAGVVSGNLEGEARAWMQKERLLLTPGLDAWDTLRPLFRARWVRPMNFTEIEGMYRDLVQKPAESVSSF